MITVITLVEWFFWPYAIQFLLISPRCFQTLHANTGGITA